MQNSCAYKNVVMELSYAFHPDYLVDPILPHLFNHHFYSLHINVKNYEGSEILSSLQANKLPCHSLIDWQMSTDLGQRVYYNSLKLYYSRHNRLPPLVPLAPYNGDGNKDDEKKDPDGWLHTQWVFIKLSNCKLWNIFIL